MNANPRISVVMTVYNTERFIREAVDSILGQTFSDFEFIIVDNDSRDKTKDIIRSYNDERIVLIENKENLGQTMALNIGLKAARGEFIARMDADDVALPQRFELQLCYLIGHEDVAVVGSWHEEIDERGRHVKYFKMPTDPLQIKCYLVSPGRLGYYCLSHPTVMIRKEVFLQVGLYDAGYLAQDYDLWVRISRKHKIANLGKVLLKRRLSNNQQTKESKQRIGADCGRIIAANIRYYLPDIEEGDLTPLVRMLQYKPQSCRDDGLRVLGYFDLFLKRIIDSDGCSGPYRDARAKMEAFYMFQLMKTNAWYSLRCLAKITFSRPNILLGDKFYRKLTLALIDREAT